MIGPLHHTDTQQEPAETEPKALEYNATDERLRAAYLNSVAYGYDLENPPRMDKTLFWCGKHEDQENVEHLQRKNP